MLATFSAQDASMTAPSASQDAAKNVPRTTTTWADGVPLLWSPRADGVPLFLVDFLAYFWLIFDLFNAQQNSYPNAYFEGVVDFNTC